LEINLQSAPAICFYCSHFHLWSHNDIFFLVFSTLAATTLWALSIWS